MALSLGGDASFCDRMAQSKAVTYLDRNSIGRSVHICRGEPEHVEAGTHEVILAAIVVNEPFMVVGAVVLDCQALYAIEEVWTT